MTGSAAAKQLARRLLPSAGFAALAAYTVARAALRFAYSDDFDLALGKWPPPAAWLWAQHNEHRLPLPKLLLAWCARHGDFRVGVGLSLALMTGACAWLVARVDREDRGVAVRVLVPAVLLCPASNAWHWDVELQFVACAALFVVAFAAALTAARARDAVVVALASISLPLTGGNGVVLSVATVLASLALARDGTRDRWARAIFATGAAATLAIDAAYLIGYHAPPQHEALHAASLPQLGSVAAHLLVAPLGALAERAVVIAAPLGALAFAAAVVMIARAPRRFVFACFFAGSLALVAVIAAARAGRGWPPGLELHYAPLIAPAYVVAVVALAPLLAQRRVVALVACTGAVAMCLAYVPTATPESRLRERAFIADCGRAPADLLAARHLPLFYYVDTPAARAVVARYLATLDCDAIRP
ncbi:MAG TPA: hypothetical protein VGL86_29070 [Polyangia bacterium]